MSGALAQVLLAGVWGGLLAVERRAFLQAMFSRPLVAATVMGLLLDDVPSGLYVGMLLELYHLGSATLGAALSENDTLVATGTAAAAAAMSNASGGGGTAAIWTVSILIFVGLGRVGRFLDRRLEPYNTMLSRKALARAEKGELARAVRQNLWGMWPHAVLYGSITACCALIGRGLGPYWTNLPLTAPGLVRGLAWAFPAMASVAAAIAARGSHARKAPVFAGATAAIVTVVILAIQMRRGM